MCNLGQGIEDRATERATEKTNEKVVWNMYQEGYALDQISKVVEISIDEVEKIIKNKENCRTKLIVRQLI